MSRFFSAGGESGKSSNETTMECVKYGKNRKCCAEQTSGIR